MPKALPFGNNFEPIFNFIVLQSTTEAHHSDKKQTAILGIEGYVTQYSTARSPQYEFIFSQPQIKRNITVHKSIIAGFIRRTASPSSM